MPKFPFSFTNFLQEKIGSYSTLSTQDQNDVIRERMRRTRSTKSVDKPPAKKSNHRDTITSLGIVRSGMILSGSRDTKLLLTNTDTGELSNLWAGHDREISKIAYRNTVAKHVVLSGSRDNKINLWVFNSPNCVRTFTGHKLTISGLVTLEDNKFVSGSRDTTVKIWDLERGDELRSVALNRNLVTHMAFNAGHSLIAQTSEDKTLKLWDSRSLQLVHTYPMKNHIQLHCDFTEDAYHVYSSSNGFNGDGCEITLYDVRKMQPWRELRGHEGSVTCVSNLPLNEHKRTLVSVGADKTIRVWRYDDGALMWTEEAPFEVDSLQCCAYQYGHVIVSGGRGRLAHFVTKSQAGRIGMETQWVQAAPIPISSSSNEFNHSS